MLINRWYPPHTGYGGIAMYNYYLAHALQELGHRVSVLAARWEISVPEYENDGGVHVYRMFYRQGPLQLRLPCYRKYARSIGHLSYSRRLRGCIRRLNHENEIDIIEFAEINGEGYAYLKQKLRKPVVVRCHTPTFVLDKHYSKQELPFSTALTSWLENRSIKLADGLTTPSKDMRQTISNTCSVPSDQITVVPNMLNIRQFIIDNAEDYSLNNSLLTVLHVGRLDRIKGIEVLTSAIPLVLAAVPNTKFVFVGSGEEWKNKLTERMRCAGVLENIEFTGGVEQETLIRWYRRATITVVPSLNYESFSYTCAEAMAAGKPVVASNIGGIPETVDNRINGILVAPGNVSQLADAIIELLLDRPLRVKMGKNGREKALREFEAVKVAKKTLCVYEEVIAEYNGFSL